MKPLTLSTGLKLLRQKAYKEVHGGAIEAIKKDVSDPLPYFLLGVIASEHENYSKALELFSKAADFGPDVIDYQVHHAKTLSTLGCQNAAKVSADKAVKLKTDDVFLLDTLGVIYSRAGYHEAAIPLFERTVSLNPNQANFHYNLAASAQFSGDFDKAKTAYEDTLRLEPKFYRAWSSLISLKKQTPDSNHLETLIPLFEEASDNAEGQLQLGHAIAKTLEDLGRHHESLEWLLKGKEAKRNQLRYNRTTGQALFSAAKTTSETKQGHSKPSLSSPIFIVGLPRTCLLYTSPSPRDRG